MNRALQCLPSFQNFLEERGFEKVTRGVSIYSATPVNAYAGWVYRAIIDVVAQ